MHSQLFFQKDASKYYFREDFVSYAKTCGSVKDYLEKSGRDHQKSTRPLDSGKPLDKASLAFNAIDKDHSGFVDREEFLQFTR